MRKLLSGLVAVIFSAGIAAAAFIPLLAPNSPTGIACSEPSQSLYCYNQVVGQVNAFLGLVAAQPGPVAATATSGEQSLATTTIPGGTLNAAGQSLRLRCAGTTAANTDAKLMRLYFGNAAISTGAIQTSAANWELELVVQYGTATSVPYFGRGSYGSAITVSPISFDDVSDNLANAITAKCTSTQSNSSVAGEVTEQVFMIEQVK